MWICWSHPSSYVLPSGYLTAETVHSLHASHSHILPRRVAHFRFASSRFAMSISPLCFVKVSLNAVTEMDTFLGCPTAQGDAGHCWAGLLLGHCSDSCGLRPLHFPSPAAKCCAALWLHSQWMQWAPSTTGRPLADTQLGRNSVTRICCGGRKYL